MSKNYRNEIELIDGRVAHRKKLRSSAIGGKPPAGVSCRERSTEPACSVIDPERQEKEVSDKVGQEVDELSPNGK